MGTNTDPTERMLSTIALVVTLLAVTNSAPVIKRTGFNTCAEECEATSNIFFKEGVTYVYEYTSSAITSIPGVPEDAALTSKLTAHVKTVTPCEMTLQITNVELITTDPTNSNMDKLEEFKEKLMAAPITFAYIDGVVKHICSTDEEIWALNVKRSLISGLQISTGNAVVASEAVFETDVMGTCKTTYAVAKLDDGTMSVQKTKDMEACTARPMTNFMFHGLVPELNMDNTMMSLIKSTHGCEHTITEDKILKAACRENHVFQPFTSEKSGAVTYVLYEMVWVDEFAADTIEEPIEEPIEEKIEEPIEEKIEEPIEETIEEKIEETIEETI